MTTLDPMDGFPDQALADPRGMPHSGKGQLPPHLLHERQTHGVALYSVRPLEICTDVSSLLTKEDLSCTIL